MTKNDLEDTASCLHYSDDWDLMGEGDWDDIYYDPEVEADPSTAKHRSKYGIIEDGYMYLLLLSARSGSTWDFEGHSRLKILLPRGGIYFVDDATNFVCFLENFVSCPSSQQRRSNKVPVFVDVVVKKDTKLNSQESKQTINQLQPTNLTHTR